MAMFGWTLHGDGRTIGDGAIVAPTERLTWPRTVGLGAQHLVAMFGATFLVPALTGFPPTTTLLFSGLGTCLFLLITGNRVPSYLGSSFAFIAPILAAGSQGSALFGVMATGLLLALVGGVVVATGSGWIDALMPPIVTGSIVALIGLNLSGTATKSFQASPWVALITLVTLLLAAVVFTGMLARLAILLGVVVGYVAAAIGGVLDFAPVERAAWLGLPDLTHPDPTWSVLPAFLPVVLVLIAENVGHVRTVAHLTDDPEVDARSGRALLADGVATTLAGLGGGSGTTTYGENIGVMAATRVYSTAAYWVAGLLAVALSLSPKVGALVDTIPAGVLGGVTVALYGLIGVVGIKIWVDRGVDLSDPVNQLTAAVALVIGIGNLTLSRGDVQVTGIALGTVAALVVYHGMRAVERLRGRAAEPLVD